MDGDPTVEPELDAFSRVLPLPYRVAIILVCGRIPSGPGLHMVVLTLSRNLGMGAQPALLVLGQD